MGKTILINVKKSPGCLCVALTHHSKVLSLKEASFLTCALCLLVVKLPTLTYLAAVLLVLVVAFILYKTLFSVAEENLLIVKGLAYQTCCKFPLRKTALYIPYEQVQKVFINEVILRHKVIHVLSLLVDEGSNRHKLVPLFTETLLKLDCLEMIYRHIKHFQNS